MARYKGWSTAPEEASQTPGSDSTRYELGQSNLRSPAEHSRQELVRMSTSILILVASASVSHQSTVERLVMTQHGA